MQELFWKMFLKSTLRSTSHNHPVLGVQVPNLNVQAVKAPDTIQADDEIKCELGSDYKSQL